MFATARGLVLALLAVFTVDVGAAEAQLWKPAKKPAAVAPTKPARAKPARAKPARRAARPTRPAARRAVVRDDPPPARARARGERADALPDFDDSPVITVEMPARSER